MIEINYFSTVKLSLVPFDGLSREHSGYHVMIGYASNLLSRAFVASDLSKEFSGRLYLLSGNHSGDKIWIRVSE